MPARPIPLEDARFRIAAVEDALREGFPPPGEGKARKNALTRACEVHNKNRNWIRNDTLRRIKSSHGIEPDWSLYAARDDGPPKIPLLTDRDFEFPSELPPDDVGTADEIIARRKAQFAKKDRYESATNLIPVKVNIDGPFGVVFIGDPHVDDDGTDLELLEGHVNIIRRTKAMFGACVGDLSNNWPARMGHLYGQQSTSAAEAWKLVEWLVHEIPWLFMVGGNHDVWSGAGDPLNWIARQAGVQYKWHGLRLALKTPKGQEIRINCRHDFTGHSQWNPAHGVMKAASMGWRDHILVCGHKHVSGYGPLVDPATGTISHAIRVGTYKRHDEYAERKGFPEGNFAPAIACIIDPEADRQTALVSVKLDVEEAAEFLTYKRKKRKV